MSDAAAHTRKTGVLNPALLISVCAIVMAYGWGYRGTVGHEAGAMVPGAMLGLAVCLASGRQDWYRRAAVAGLFTAVGFSWGGSISYMEHPKYIMSDSFPDVYYGYAMLFFLGGMWAAMAGVFLGKALTEPRSTLSVYIGPFTTLVAVYLLTYLFYFFYPEKKHAIDLYVARNWNDGEFVSALTALVVGAAYWLLAPILGRKDREGAAFIFGCAASWWLGYGLLTKIGGIELAPPGRSEMWGGILGMLIFLIVHLIRSRNYAALLVCCYGGLGGGFGFATAVFFRHFVLLNIGFLKHITFLGQWKTAEESYGLFMGIALSLAALRLLRGGIQPPAEDVPVKSMNIYAAFAILIAILWMNVRRAPMAWIEKYHSVPEVPINGLMPWAWYFIAACMFTAVAIYALYLYAKDALPIAPSTAYGKGFGIFLLLVWLIIVANFMGASGRPQEVGQYMMDLTFWVAASLSSLLLLAHSPKALTAPVPAEALTAPNDGRWRVGLKYWLGYAIAPLYLALIAWTSTAVQYAVDEAGNPLPGPYPQHSWRKRFGEDAYWRQVAEIVGTWKAVGIVAQPGDTTVVNSDQPYEQLVFDKDNHMIATLKDGTVEEIHSWWPVGAWLSVRWYDRVDGHPDAGTSDITFRNHHMYLPWPSPKDSIPQNKQPHEGFLYLERAGE